jgi:hypothetical protein
MSGLVEATVRAGRSETMHLNNPKVSERILPSGRLITPMGGSSLISYLFVSCGLPRQGSEEDAPKTFPQALRVLAYTQ